MGACISSFIIFFLFAFSSKFVDILLQLLHKHPYVIAVANGMMHLYGQGKHTFAVALKILAHGEDGQKEFAFIIHVDVESREFEPWNHGDVEGIDRRSVLGRVACGRAV